MLTVSNKFLVHVCKNSTRFHFSVFYVVVKTKVSTSDFLCKQVVVECHKVFPGIRPGTGAVDSLVRFFDLMALTTCIFVDLE